MAALRLPSLHSALVVIAHPDDESFGLGGVLDHLATAGVRVRVICLTRGEASTLGDVEDLAIVRSRELACAATHLAVDDVTLLDYPDGRLDHVAATELERVVDDRVGDADVVVVFAPGGVTAHPDHQAATRAGERVAARRKLWVLEWGVSPPVASALNAEFGTCFAGIDGDDLPVDRDAQWRAIDCHRSQSTHNPVLHRRLELQGARDRIVLRPPRDKAGRSAHPAAATQEGG